MADQDLDSLRGLIVVDEASAAAQAEQVVAEEKKILTLWSVVIRVLGGFLLIAALKILSFIQYNRALYGDFITFVETYRNTLDANGQPLYSGPSGLMTVLAIQSPFFNLFFSNASLPFAIFYSYATPDLRVLYTSCANGQYFMRNIYEVSLLGDKATGQDLDAIEICCQAAQKLLGSNCDALINKGCPVPCSVPTSGAKASIGETMFNVISSQGLNGAMTGHMAEGMISSGEASGLGAGVGFAIGAGLGIAQALLQNRNNKQLCSAAKKFCTPEFGDC